MTILVETVIVILTLIFEKDKNIDTNSYVGVTWNVIDGSILISVLVLYMYFNIKLLLIMHKRHRLEFKKHAWQQITNVVGTAFCISTLIYVDIIYLLSYMCKLPN